MVNSSFAFPVNFRVTSGANNKLVEDLFICDHIGAKKEREASGEEDARVPLCHARRSSNLARVNRESTGAVGAATDYTTKCCKGKSASMLPMSVFRFIGWKRRAGRRK